MKGMGLWSRREMEKERLVMVDGVEVEELSYSRVDGK